MAVAAGGGVAFAGGGVGFEAVVEVDVDTVPVTAGPLAVPFVVSVLVLVVDVVVAGVDVAGTVEVADPVVAVAALVSVSGAAVPAARVVMSVAAAAVVVVTTVELVSLLVVFAFSLGLHAKEQATKSDAAMMEIVLIRISPPGP